ncbi:MAG: translational repressor RegA [Patescibacteria group bacterium]|nr:translational repressor RegA [Patescibacteria group bacterium]
MTQKTRMTKVDREVLVKGFIQIAPANPEETDTFFLVLKETLTRIGISSNRNGKPHLFQTCHILHKKGKYYLVHFKELFMLDDRLRKGMTPQDEKRKRCIAKLLEDWGLIKIVSPFNRNESFHLKKLKLTVISHAEKSKWSLQSKYSIGKVKKSQVNYWKDNLADEEDV